MSIAVSAVIKPSRFFHISSLCLSVACIAILGLILLIQFDGTDIFARIMIFSGFAIALPFIFHSAHRVQNIVRIDISGTGQIRLASAAWDGEGTESRSFDVEGKLVRLLPDSTLWAQLLLLRLENDMGQIKVLIVLPDALEGDGFRLLSVACRWIAAHNNPDERKIV